MFVCYLETIGFAKGDKAQIELRGEHGGRRMFDFRKIFFIVLISSISVPAFAADFGTTPLTDKAQPTVWSGAYLGLHLGGQNVETFETGNAFSHSFTTNNFLGGALAGYNWRSGAWVAGIEGDWSLIRNGPDFHSDLFTLRGRAGWAHENLLLYVTGGVGTNNDRAGRIFIVGTSQTEQTVDKQSVGPVAGGGVEVRLPYQLSVRGEGLYYVESPRFDFVPVSLNGLTLPAGSISQKQQHLIYRASLIYNFN
jgi:outer membrane immunogenic protein